MFATLRSSHGGTLVQQVTNDNSDIVHKVCIATIKGKGKVHHTPLRERRWVHISLYKALNL